MGALATNTSTAATRIGSQSDAKLTMVFSSLSLLLVVQPHAATQLFLALMLHLALDPAQLRGARGAGGAPQFGLVPGGLHQAGQAHQCLAAIALLGAVIARENQYRPVRRQALPGRGAQTRFHALAQYRAAGQVETQLRRAGHLV